MMTSVGSWEGGIGLWRRLLSRAFVAVVETASVRIGSPVGKSLPLVKVLA